MDSRTDLGMSLRRIGLHLGWIAALLFAASIVLASIAQPGFDPARHPLALLGSALAPHAIAFNVAGFMLPGACIAAFALAFESTAERHGGARMLRIATGAMLISGVAFAAQGVVPLDPSDLDGASRRHVLAHTLAWLAWLPTLPLLALAMRGRPGWRALPALALGLGAVAIAAIVLPPTLLQRLPGGAALQWLTWALWFGWYAALAWVVLRVGHATSR